MSQSETRSGSPAAMQLDSMRWLIALLLLIVIFTAVRTVQISKYSFDSDETFSVRVATSDFSHLMLMARSDKVHPPVYYLLLRGWIALGDASESWVRAFSVLANIAGLLALVGLCRMLRLSKPYQMFAAATMAVNDFQIYYADDARMYSLLAAASALATFALERWLAKPTGKRLLLYAVCSCFMVTTHYFGWLVVAAHGCRILLFRRKSLWWFALGLLPSVAAAAAWSAYLVLGPKTPGEAAMLAHFVGWLPQPSLSSLLGLAARLSGGAESSRIASAALVFTCLCAIVAGLWRLRRPTAEYTGRETIMQLALCCAVPPVGDFAFSRLTGLSIWHQRYLIVTGIPYIVVLTYSLSQISREVLRRAAVAVVLIMGTVVALQEFRQTNRRVQWNNFCAYIQRTGPSYPIFVLDPFIEYAFKYYIGRAEISAPVQLATLDSFRASTPCWVEYNRSTWKGSAPPDEILRSRGYHIAARNCVKTPGEEFCAIQLQDQP